ncbi:MAG: SLBB domain-containing protein [Candidatus Marinimicrobia bacterium]|nr:SLBB domain-containing protein [Candidatus Neomarinimicrobiota bacterium]
MIRYALLFSFFLTFGYGQSIKDLIEQSGAAGSDIMMLQEQAGPPAAAEKIPAEVPVKETVEIHPVPDVSENLEYFGYSYFSSKSELVFLNNLPAPANYQVGAGDEIIVTIWGATQLREKGVISRDGNIYFENVGLVNMAGLNLNQAKQILKARFENVYSTLRGGASASTFIEISLGSLKSINIHFLGEVNSPGVMPIHPFSTVTTGLMQAGGISLIGSLRDIHILRNGKLLKSIDYYQYLLKGSITDDIRLLDNDVISIPVRKSNVLIKGKVKRPGVFELKEGENLSDLIYYAGGLDNDAGQKVGISRVLPLAYRKNAAEPIQHIWVELSMKDEIELIDGDKVNVPSLFLVDQKVKIYGRVKNPGDYSLSTGMDVLDLIELSGGIFQSDHWPNVYPYRADLIRQNRSELTSKIIPLQLDRLQQGIEDQNLLLEDGDRLIIYPAEINKFGKTVRILGDIKEPGEYVLNENMGLTDLILRAGGFSYSAYPSEVTINSIDPFNISKESLTSEVKIKVDPDIFNEFPELGEYKLKHMDQVFVRKYPEYQLQRNITIEGEVKFPGIYALEKKGESLKSLLERAGGLTDEAFVEGLKFVRSDKRLILERKGRGQVDLKLPLRPDDHIFIPKRSNTVEVVGAVNSPGLIQFNSGLSVSDYVNIAGNLTQNGDRETVSVYYANGESKSRTFFIDPKVREGSIIVVYQKPDELPLDKTVFLTEITTIVIQALSLILVANKLAG